MVAAGKSKENLVTNSRGYCQKGQTETAFSSYFACEQAMEVKDQGS